MISTSTHLAQLFSHKNTDFPTTPLKFTPTAPPTPSSHVTTNSHKKTEVPIGHNAELRLRWVEDVQRNGLYNRRSERSSSFWGRGRVVEGDGCQEIRRFYHEIHECTIFVWLQIHWKHPCVVCWNNICKIHSMYIAEDCRDFLAKKQSWIGGLELVTFLRIPHQARKVEMIPFGSWNHFLLLNKNIFLSHTQSQSQLGWVCKIYRKTPHLPWQRMDPNSS